MVLNAQVTADFDFTIPAEKAFTDQSGNGFNPVKVPSAESISAERLDAAKSGLI